MTDNHTFDCRFKTWPLRIKKKAHGTLSITPQLYEISYKNYIMSLDVLPDKTEIGTCLLSTCGSEMDRKQALETDNLEKIDTNQNLSLDSLLESLPLVYNPGTKQLQIVKLKSKLNNTVGSVVTNHLSRKYHITQNAVKNIKQNRFAEEELCELISRSHDDSFITEKLGANLSSGAQEESENCTFATTIDVESVLLKNGNCLSEDKDKASESQIISSPLKSVVIDSIEPSTIKKRKGITDLFTRNLFPWRSKKDGKFYFNQSENEDSTSLSVCRSEELPSPWKIFSKAESASTLDSKDFTHELPAGSVGLIMEERPGDLPAKTHLEQQKHKLEYKSIIFAAKKKEIKEAKERRKAQALLLKQEKQLSDSVHVWNTVILPKWSTMRGHKKCQDLWWSGLPSCIRGKVWKLAIGNDLSITSQLYKLLVQRSCEKLSKLNRSKSLELRDGEEEPAGQESTLRLIQMDVSRTFPHLCIFQNGGPFHDPLHNILGAYVCYRPDIGYVQGMSFLAATLLLNMDESEAFIYFANLINRPPHLAFFSIDQRVMQGYFLTFEQILKENLPNLADHLQSLNVSPNMYLLDWVLTVFARSFPLDVAARMWDIYLRDGEEFLFRAAIGILKHFEKELLAEDCTTLTAQFLTRLPEDVSVEALFKDVASVPVLVTGAKKRIKEVLEANLGRNSDSSIPVVL